MRARPAARIHELVSREATPTWFFVLCVVRRGDAFLVVEERKHGGGWYVPAGRVEPGEGFVEAARRETLEEAGVEIAIDGVLRVEHAPRPDGTRIRVIFAARPVDPSSTPRQTPNEHTLGARFATLDELRSLRLRGSEVLEMFEAVAAGAPIAPLSTLTWEGAPWR